MPPVHVWQYAWQIASAHLWHTTEYSDLFWLLDSYRRYQENSYDLKKPFHTALKWLLWTVDINCWNKLLAAKSMQAIMKAYPSKIRMSSRNLPWGKKNHTHTHKNQPENQATTQSSGPMALEQDSVHSFLFLSALNAAFYRHFIFDFIIHESMLNTLSYSTLNKQYIYKILQKIQLKNIKYCQIFQNN